MPRGVVISDCHGFLLARYLVPLGLDIVPPRRKATIGDVMQTYLGDGGWDNPVDPFHLDKYEVSTFEIELNILVYSFYLSTLQHFMTLYLRIIFNGFP